jgi:hypothetical protein
VIAVAATDLHGFADLATQFVHDMARLAEEIERPGIDQPVVVKARPKPDEAFRPPRKHVAFNQFVDDDIDGRERRADRLGDGITAGGLAGGVEMVEDLQRAIHAAHTRATRRLGVFRFRFGEAALDRLHRGRPFSLDVIYYIYME